MGENMVTGKCFMAKNASIQLETTIADFRNTCRCSLKLRDGAYIPITIKVSGKNREPITTGKKMTVLVSVAKNSTGSTALPFSDVFLKIS